MLWFEKEGGPSSPLAPASTLASMTALIGAMPVPGPTQMMGVAGSGGSLIKPFWMPNRILSPSENQKHGYKTSNEAVPGCKPDKNDVHTPVRGTFSLVRYRTMATHRCTWCGCL
jgi:hypothetical protein